jgi:predicted RNA-binding protein YlxR (DUF448 family)
MSEHDPREGPQRRCILSGTSEPSDGLIRLALSPDGAVLPDVGACAPGRGAWISSDKAAIAAAEAKGKLRGALARAFKGDVREVPSDLAGRIEAALKRTALDRLGLELAGGRLLLGSERIASALAAGEVQVLLHAADASDDGIRKLEQRSHAGGGKARSVALPCGRDELSLALGQSNVVHAALRDRQAALRVEAAVNRWRRFLGLGEEKFADAAGAASGVNEGCKGYA